MTVLKKTVRLYYIGIIIFLSAMPVIADTDTIVTEEPVKLSEPASHTLNDALTVEDESVRKIDQLLAQEESNTKLLLREMGSFRLQYSTHANLLLLPDITVKLLEKANSDHGVSLSKIRHRIQEISRKSSQISEQLVTAGEQIKINKEQLTKLKEQEELTPEIHPLIKGYQQLLKTLEIKESLLKNLSGLHKATLDNLKLVEEDFSLLSGKFDQEINSRKHRHLFRRNVFQVINTGETLVTDVHKLFEQFSRVTSTSFWNSEIEFIKTAGSINVISFFGLYGVFLIMFMRLRPLLHSVMKKDFFNTFWIKTTLHLLDKTLYLLATIVFLFVFTQSGILHSKNPLIVMILNILATWIYTRWFLIIFNRLAEGDTDVFTIRLVYRLRILVHILRIFAVICIIGNWIYIEPNVVFIAVRLLILSALYVWCVWFWGLFQKYIFQHVSNISKQAVIVINSVKYLTYGIITIGILSDVAGFGTFAFFWLTSWARSSVVILCATLLFLCAGELTRSESSVSQTAPDDESAKRIPIRWFISRVGLVALVVFIFISIVYAWGGKQTVLINVYTRLKAPITVGSWELSILGLLLAIAVLFITQALARSWKQFFHDTLLKESGIDPGVQESVSMISFYLIWFIGILVSLNMFGVSMKSVTVIFGALGIGLGFGLQTIFNNFISGIILLFERPIQVGDDLEIDGVWATVKKINVRSTVVQTYDNATLIIPNSEFVSAKVINWSFKDKRIRRRIDVGVAYGSDTELVKKTLLEVAEKTPRILKLPKPDVMFTNFGDNSLNFVLRIWTRVDYFMSVETEARFEIDRLFRERNIEISFPQRDLHIRSVNRADVEAVLNAKKPSK